MISYPSGRGDDRPAWSRRLRLERGARSWSQRDAVRAMQAHAGVQLASEEALIRTWKRWESGECQPDPFYRSLLAKTLGTVTGALFPTETRRDREADILAVTGLETLEIVARLRCSDVSATTLDALRITTDRICSDYPHVSSAELTIEGHDWLQKITMLLDRRLTLSQHREVLTIAGYLTLLVGCLEYDMGDRPSADASRLAALSLGDEAGNADLIGWGHEMRAWYSLTQGDCRGAIVASELGQQAAPTHGVAVQLAAQKAKAGLESVTVGRPRSPWTEDADCWNPSHGRRILTTTSSSTLQSSISTPWTVTEASAKTDSPRRSPEKCCAPGRISTVQSAHPCATRKLG